MGQYYMPVFGNKNGNNIRVFDRSVNGDYTMAKLMEHSWWLNDCLSCATEYIISNGKVRLAWVGDYAEQDDFEGDFKAERHIAKNVAVPNLEKVWGDDVKPQGFFHEYKVDDEGNKELVDPVFLNDRYLINHDQKIYIDCDEYYNKAKEISDWIVNPLSLLTAVGNGRGGGDYHTNNAQEEAWVGSWAWNFISIDGKVPKGYKKADILFYEKW
jgi:hypothetical protein